MRIHSFLLLFCLATASASAETPWEKYLLEPTPKNARLVSAIEYSDETDAFYSDIRLLEVQVSAGDEEAFKLVVRLHPALLLTQFESDPRFTSLLTGILITVGEEYVDRPLARRYELQARRDALKSVDLDSENSGLTRLLAILDKEIESLGWATANDR